MALPPESRPCTPVTWAPGLIRAVVLLIPAALLLVGYQRSNGNSQSPLIVGAGLQFLIAALAILKRRSWEGSAAQTVITLYLIALGWLWIGAAALDDWYAHLAQAILLLVPLVVFAQQTLHSSGALSVRRANILSQRLTKRQEWPSDLSRCGDLPEVKAFREAVQSDASPALNLLNDPRAAVRAAALAALEFRKAWRPGQAELVLEIARTAAEPAVRAAAVSALANLDDRPLIEELAEVLQDPEEDVRRVATEALLWDCEHRWHWIRPWLRQALAQPHGNGIAPLPLDSQSLTAEAIDDLHAWAAEKGLLGARAAQILAAYYGRLIAEQPNPDFIQSLQRQIADPQAPPTLRVELTHLLRRGDYWDAELQENLLSAANPASIRLLAAEALLSKAPHNKAVNTLYEIARLSNREMALATADVAQRCLGVDFGLALGQPLPSLHSRQALEITRRVLNWGAQQISENRGQGSGVRTRASGVRTQ